MSTTLYCCKMCKDGVVFRFNSPRPCSGDSLLCTDPKNPCEYFDQEDDGNGAGKDPTCVRGCRDEWRTCRRSCMPRDTECREDCKKTRDWCINACPDAEDGDENGNGDCPHGRGEDVPQFPQCQCGAWYAAATGDHCVSGYTWVPRGGQAWEGWEEGMHGRCECTPWMEAHTPTGDGDQFEWSEDLQELIKQLMERIKQLFQYPRGLTDEERQAVINYMTRSIKLGERGRLEALNRRLARMGMADSELALEEERGLGRETAEITAGAKQGLAVDELTRRFEELMGTTGMSSQLIQQILGSEQMVEALNAARRGEGRQDLALFINYLQSLLGGQTAGQQPYWQAILNYMNQQQGQGYGGGGNWGSWLPYLIYYLFPSGSS